MATTTRTKRTPVSGYRNVLTYSNQEPGYVYRWVTDVDGRLAQFEAAGYETIPSGEGAVGDKRVGTASTIGSVVSKPVGGGFTAVLMRIKKEWYDEDQQKKLDIIRMQEAEIRDAGSSLANGYGSVKF